VDRRIVIDLYDANPVQYAGIANAIWAVAAAVLDSGDFAVQFDQETDLAALNDWWTENERWPEENRLDASGA
jgi:hypothetical protein